MRHFFRTDKSRRATWRGARLAPIVATNCQIGDVSRLDHKCITKTGADRAAGPATD